MFKKKNLIRILIILGVLLIIGFAVAKKKGVIGKPDVTRIATEMVKKRTITETVSASGKIAPEVEVKLSPDVSGEIIELLVKEGDQVKAGDFLAKINPELYISANDRAIAGLNTAKANLANAKARFAQVKAQFVNAKASFERNSKLFEQNTISQAEFDNAKSQYEVAEAEVSAAEENVRASEFSVNSAQAGVKEARENLTKTTIYAPVSGTISKLNVEKGERVAGASQFSSGTEILRIANLQNMEVNVSVNENDIVRVNLGDTALVEVDAYQNRKFKGLVTEISTSANTTGVSADQVTNFDVKIRILPDSYKDLINPSHPNKSPFRPGMSATVDIQTESVTNVLAVPIQAVTTRIDSTKINQENAEMKDKKSQQDEGNNKEETKKKNGEIQEIVFVYKDGKARKVNVKTGIQDNSYITIKEGLKETDEVIVAPYRTVSKKLKDGDEVKKVDIKDLYKSEK